MKWGDSSWLSVDHQLYGQVQFVDFPTGTEVE